MTAPTIAPDSPAPAQKWSDEAIRGLGIAPGQLTLSIELAARALGISRATAYVAAQRGDIPMIRVGGRRLVPVDKLLAMLESA